MISDHKHGNIYLVFIHHSFQKCKINIFFDYLIFIYNREQETIDVERKLRYEFMCERCHQEMPVERR
jgi:hypothetical protein